MYNYMIVLFNSNYESRCVHNFVVTSIVGCFSITYAMPFNANVNIWSWS